MYTFNFSTDTVHNSSQKKRAITLFIIAFAFIISVFTPLINSNAVSARVNNDTPIQEAEATTHYRLLRDCVKNNMYGTIQLNASDNGIAKPSQWFDDNDAHGYTYPAGKTSCKDAAETGLKLWGWGTDFSKFLEDAGYTYDASAVKWVGPGDSGNGETRQAHFDSAVQAKYYTQNFGGDPSLSDAARYVNFLNVFTKACSAKDLGVASSISNDSYKKWVNESSADRGKEVSFDLAGVNGLEKGYYVYFSKVKIVGKNTKGEVVAPEHGFAYQSVTAGDTWHDGGLSPGGGRVKMYGYHNRSVERTCDEIQKGVNDYAGAFVSWQKSNPTSNVIPSTDPNNTGGTTNTEEGASACQVEGLGWILCPVINAMASMTDSLFGVVGAMMEVTALGFNTDNPLFDAWAIMRTVANVAFIIAFLIIIFSQLTGAGVSNYGVKKMLPRLIIAAILVNISYFLCALAVDISNVLGWSVQQVLTNMADQVGGAQNTLAQDWGSIVTSVLSGAVITTGLVGVTAALSGLTVWGMLAGLLPLLVGALFAILIAFLVLIARQAFIVMLIVISPIAFVAFLLPNTEGLFKKWRSFFVTLLALFPMMALVFGGSVLASSIMRAGAQAQLESEQANLIGFFLYLGSVAVLSIPFFITPLLIKLSSGVLNRFAGMVNSPHKGPFDSMRKGAERLRDNTRQAGYANKLNSNGKIMGFGARRKYRKTQTDQAIKTRVSAAEAGITIADDKSAELARSIGNSEHLAQTFTSETKVDVEAQKDSALTYRQKLADLQIKADNTRDQAYFEESKSTSQPILAGDPLAQQKLDARHAQEEVNISASQIRYAEGVLQKEYANELKVRPGMARRAGGIDPRGESRVVANAEALLNKAIETAISEEKSTMSTLGVADKLDPTGALVQGLGSVMRDPSPSVTIERKAAAVGQIVKTGTDGDIHAAFDYISSLPQSAERTMLQQQFAADVGARKPMAIGAGVMSSLARGEHGGATGITNAFEDAIVQRFTGGKVGADALYGASAEELSTISSVLSTRSLSASNLNAAELKTNIAVFKTSPNFKQPSPEIAALVNTIETNL